METPSHIELELLKLPEGYYFHDPVEKKLMSMLMYLGVWLRSGRSTDIQETSHKVFRDVQEVLYQHRLKKIELMAESQ